MQKMRVVLVTVVFLAVAAATVTAFLQRTDHALQQRVPPRELDDLDAILHALDVFPPVGKMNESEQATFSKRWKDRQEAVEKLRQLRSKVLPRLMEEVRAAGKVEATNRAAATDATRRIILAFDVLGGDARPILPELIEEFHAGRSIGASISGIKYIGGTDAGLALLPGLTNSDPYICNGVMSALSSFGTNRAVALAATSPILLHLQDSSTFSRALASTVLGSLRSKPEVVIPALLQLAESDPDFVVRGSAIKAIGCFGTNAVWVEPRLKTIATADKDAHVRRTAEIALLAVQGKIDPDHQSVRVTH
jgi:HEAT repeat protein